MTGTTRRRVILGAAALALVGTTPVRPADDATLQALGLELRRLRRRCQGLGRLMQVACGASVWADWSRSVDEQADLCRRIARLPVNSVDGVAVRYEAIACELLDDDLLLDSAVRQRVAALRSELRRLAAAAPDTHR